MTRSKYLNPQEKKFAELVANNVDHTPPHVLAYQAGYNGTIDNVMTKASFLLKNDKVSKLIAALREDRRNKISDDFHEKFFILTLSTGLLELSLFLLAHLKSISNTSSLLP
jgi:hypothetical protein